MLMMTDAARAPSLWRRFAAMFYDAFLLLACVMVLGFVFFFINDGEAIVAGNPLLHVLRVAIVATSWLFFAYFWSRQSQTLGMRAWRLVVVDEAGRSPAFWRASLRWLLALITLLPLGAGLWWSLFDRDRRTLYGRFSRTRLYVLAENPYKKIS